MIYKAEGCISTWSLELPLEQAVNEMVASATEDAGTQRFCQVHDEEWSGDNVLHNGIPKK